MKTKWEHIFYPVSWSGSRGTAALCLQICLISVVVTQTVARLWAMLCCVATVGPHHAAWSKTIHHVPLCAVFTINKSQIGVAGVTAVICHASHHASWLLPSIMYPTVLSETPNIPRCHGLCMSCLSDIRCVYVPRFNSKYIHEDVCICECLRRNHIF